MKIARSLGGLTLQFPRPLSPTVPTFTARAPFTSISSVFSQQAQEPSELFEYTSGRWIYNDTLRHSERRRVFNVSEFKRLAAASVNQNAEDVTNFQKLAEGGFNRTFLITMRDGFQFVGRIPYLITEPRNLVIASEVATMDFLRLHGIPVPEVYGYSTTFANPAGTEYIFMELVPGTSLGDIWFDLSENSRITVITKLVELESQLFSLQFPAGGSLYYTHDLHDFPNKIGIPGVHSEMDNRFCLGPDTSWALWHGRRLGLQVDCGPYRDSTMALITGAKKEIAYLKTYGQPIHPFQRLYREIYDYQKQSHSEHLDSLEKFLKVAPFLIPHDSETLTRPTIRHPDLQPNNVFLSEDLEITGLIDWQHCAVLPAFLQCGIPDSIQNYGDSVSENLDIPILPENFEELSEEEQSQEEELLRKRQVHYFYVKMTRKLNPLHYDALTYNFNTLRNKLFRHASDPWEGDNITLKADLVQLTRSWSRLIHAETRTDDSAEVACPITFSEEEARECLRLSEAQADADEQLEACKRIIGVASEGWVPSDQYAKAKHCANKLKADAFDTVESEEEEKMVREHWIFDDFDEKEYF